MIAAAAASVAVEQPTHAHIISGLPVDHRSKIIALLRSNADRTTLHAALKDAGILKLGERLRLLNLLAPTERLLPRCYFCTQKWERFDWNTHTSTKNNNLELTMFKQLLPSDCEIVLFEPTTAAIAGLEPHAGGVILNISSNAITYDNACRAVAACRPRVILHTSDEWGQSPEFFGLANLCTLYLRQYRHTSYPGFDAPQIKYLVTAYNSAWTNVESLQAGMVNSWRRPLVWGFCGNKTSADRPEMLTELERRWSWRDGLSEAVDNASPDYVQELYLKATFVPVGRGAVVLDCSRIVEAAACGAIPIIVGPLQEIEGTFCGWPGVGTPPWLFAGTWAQASEAMAALIVDREELDARQQQVIRWWQQAVEYWRGEISRALG